MAMNPHPGSPDTVRLFFALWPIMAASTDLTEAGKRLHGLCGGRQTRTETIHLTLVFLGAVALERVTELLSLAADVHAPAFGVDLTQLGWWPHNGIVWAAPKNTPAELSALVDALREKLSNAGFLFEESPFVPHVTLLRKSDCKKNAFPAVNISWRAEDFVLVKSVQGEGGAAYEVLGRWALN